jgi:hypothetical protein
LNKNTVTPDFPPKQLFGKEDQMFIDQRATLLSAYFSTLIKHKRKLKYDLSAWESYFMKNKIDDEEEDKKTKQKFSRDNINSVDLSLKKSISNQEKEKEKSSQESNFQQFQKHIIQIENSLVHHLYERSNNKTISQDSKDLLKEVKALDNEDELLFKACLDFCGNINEMIVLEEDNEQVYWNEEIIYNFKS